MAKQEYIEKNRQWLADKAKEPGVKALDKGIYYKVLKNGNQKTVSPNRGSVVNVHYTGKTINGKIFDSSRGGVAPAFRLRELYIPAEQGYGRLSQPGIPGGSTLIFEIELLGVM